MTTTTSKNVGTTMDGKSKKPAAPAGLAAVAKSRKSRSDKGTAKAMADIGMAQSVAGSPATTDRFRGGINTSRLIPKFESNKRVVPVTVEQEFEDRTFIVEADDLPRELREFVLRTVDLPYKGPGANPEFKIKIDPMTDQDVGSPGEFTGLRFTVTLPVNN